MEDHIFNIFEYVTSSPRASHNDEEDPLECLADLQTIITDYWDWLPDPIYPYDEVQEARADIAQYYPQCAKRVSSVTTVETLDLETEAYNIHWQNKHLAAVLTKHDWVRFFRSDELPVSVAVSALEISLDTSCLDVLRRVNTILSNSIMLANLKAKLAVHEFQPDPGDDNFQTFLWLRSSIIAEILNDEVEFESRDLIKSAAKATHVELQKGQAYIDSRAFVRWAMIYRTHLPPYQDLAQLSGSADETQDMLALASTYELPPNGVFDCWGRRDRTDIPFVFWMYLRQSASELSRDPCYQRFAGKVKALCVAGGLPSDISEDTLQNLAALEQHVWEKRAPGPGTGYIMLLREQMQKMENKIEVLQTRNGSLTGDLNKQSRIITNLSYRYLLEQLPRDKADGPAQAWGKFFNDAFEAARTEQANDFKHPLAKLFQGTDKKDIEGLRDDGKKLYNRLSKNIHHYSSTWDICGDWDEGERRIMTCLTPHKNSIKAGGIVDWDKEAKRHMKPPDSKEKPAAVPMVKNKKAAQYKWPESTQTILTAAIVAGSISIAFTIFNNFRIRASQS